MEDGRSKLIINGLIILAVVGAIVASYFFLKGRSSDFIDTTITDSVTSSADITSLRLISKLNELKSITLERELFSREDFQALLNLGTAVIPEPVGILNPFGESSF